MEYLNTHDEITNKIARQKTGIRSEGTIKQAFDKLRNKGLIELVPGKAQKSEQHGENRKKKTSQEENSPTIYDSYPKYEKQIMEYLVVNEEITNKRGREVTGVESTNTMTNIFKRLRRKGFIELVPSKKFINSAWRKIK